MNMNRPITINRPPSTLIHTHTGVKETIRIIPVIIRIMDAALRKKDLCLIYLPLNIPFTSSAKAHPFSQPFPSYSIVCASIAFVTYDALLHGPISVSFRDRNQGPFTRPVDKRGFSLTPS